MTPDELLARQAELQTEAQAVAGDLELAERLGCLGTPVRVGSAALGVMVARDVDVTVICSDLDERRAAILAIKTARAELPADRPKGNSFDVCRAVLEGGDTTAGDFDRWLAAEGRPHEGS